MQAGLGFDIPEGKHAMFYSPKEEEHIMWQEVLRIRSMRRDMKKVYVLFYENTAEEAKKARLEVQTPFLALEIAEIRNSLV